MITRVHSASIVVSDKDRAVDFYVNKLGFEKRLDQGMGDGSDYRFVTVAPPGSEAELSLELGQVIGREPGGNTGISLIATDAQATFDDLKAKGVNVVDMHGNPATAPETMPWGDIAFWFKDPDDNMIFVNSPAS